MTELPQDPHVMVLLGFANGQDMPHAGTFLRGFDFDAHDGVGQLDCTPHLHMAKVFEGVAGVMEFWKTQSTVRPLREDGKPNRPLTAATIQPMPLLGLIPTYRA